MIDAKDLAVWVTEYLLDNAPHLLAPEVLEVNKKYTDSTFELQDEIEEATNQYQKRNA